MRESNAFDDWETKKRNRQRSVFKIEKRDLKVIIKLKKSDS